MDPRGPLPAMNAPHLGYAMPGGLTGGATERIRPKTGRLVMFPAWMTTRCGPIAAPPNASPSRSI